MKLYIKKALAISTKSQGQKEIIMSNFFNYILSSFLIICTSCSVNSPPSFLLKSA